MADCIIYLVTPLQFLYPVCAWLSASHAKYQIGFFLDPESALCSTSTEPIQSSSLPHIARKNTCSSRATERYNAV